MRTGFTSIGFLIFMLLNGSFLESLEALDASLLFWLFVSGFFAFFLGDVLYLAALNEIGVSRAVPISSTYPLFVALLAFLIYREEVGAHLILGTIVILIAIKIISEEEGDGAVKSKKGLFLALSAAVCWSISITILEYLTNFLPSEAVAGFRFVIAFLLVSAVVKGRGFNFNRSSALWIGFGGMIVLVTSNYTFVEAIRMIGSAKVAPVSSTYPVISAFFASVFLRERLTFKIVFGTILSVIGVLIVVTF
jgi:DME family drug/metabolite transporter